jgi:hypothetical protein
MSDQSQDTTDQPAKRTRGRRRKVYTYGGLTIGVTVQRDLPVTPAYLALWRNLLAPLPSDTPDTAEGARDECD